MFVVGVGVWVWKGEGERERERERDVAASLPRAAPARQVVYVRAVSGGGGATGTFPSDVLASLSGRLTQWLKLLVATKCITQWPSSSVAQCR